MIVNPHAEPGFMLVLDDEYELAAAPAPDPARRRASRVGLAADISRSLVTALLITGFMWWVMIGMPFGHVVTVKSVDKRVSGEGIAATYQLWATDTDGHTWLATSAAKLQPGRECIVVDERITECLDD